MTDADYDEMPTEALVALRAGRKVEAIRIVREQTGMGLAEAKTLVDRAAGDFSPQAPQKAASSEDTGLLRLLAAFIVLGGLAAAWWML
jgi:ribosomal protein L7/L12